MNRIDTTLAKRAIETAGENRVPVDDAIKCNAIVQGAMDNFDHDKIFNWYLLVVMTRY